MTSQSSLMHMYTTLAPKSLTSILQDEILITVLSDEQLMEFSDDGQCIKDGIRAAIFIAGYVNLKENCVILWNANLEIKKVDLDVFAPSETGVKPDFKKFKIIDYGYGIAFGDNYEAASGWVSNQAADN